MKKHNSNTPTPSPWNQEDKQTWFRLQSIQRSYEDHVIKTIQALSHSMECIQYGELSINPTRYPLFLLKSASWDQDKPTVLITGGVHGYETSGVQGALRFLTDEIKNHPEFNFIVAPCISPWSYETINRWNPKAIDPNRSFYNDSPAEECRALMNALNDIGAQYRLHIDLHETTDTDKTVFQPALAARDNIEPAFSDIPDGFYLVGDTSNPCDEFQKHIIEEVSTVTHIAPADSHQCLIGTPLRQQGVILYDTKAAHLCTGFTNAQYNTTTEVYPDSDLVDDENCIQAQVTAITAALDFLLKHKL